MARKRKDPKKCRYNKDGNCELELQKFGYEYPCCWWGHCPDWQAKDKKAAI